MYQRMRCTGCGACVSSCPRGAITHDGEEIEGNTGVVVHREKCVRCYTCVNACQFRAMRKCGAEYTASELVASIKPDLPFFRNSGGGVTVTGGEPLAQPDFTFDLLSLCRSSGINTLLETSGQGAWEDLRRIAGVCSAIYFDIKLINPLIHRQWTGLSNEIIIGNLLNLCKIEGEAEKITVRVPCIPDVNDSKESIWEIAIFVMDLGIRNMQLLPYNVMAGEKYRWIGRTYFLEKAEARDKSYYEELNSVVESVGLKALG